MTASQAYQDEWKNWHKQRVDFVTQPYGYLSVLCQDWLPENELFACEFVPGEWLLKDGEVYYHPDKKGLERGEFLIIDGKEAREPTHIPHGYNKFSGTGSGVISTYKDLEVETITRLNAKGETISAVRVRDPKMAELKRFDDIETFALDEKWVVPAKFSPTEHSLHTVQTVESGIYEASFIIGNMELLIEGQTFNVEVNGHRGGSAQTGYFVDLCYVHLGDQTNGKESYGGGRIVELHPDELKDIKALDLNRLVSFSCAFSTFMACPSTPTSNRLPFRVTAGEFTPPIPHERIVTYKG